MLLTLSKRNADRVAIEVIDDEGQTLFQKIVNRYSEKDVKLICRITGWNNAETVSQLNQCCEVETDEPDYNTHTVVPPQSLINEWTIPQQTEERTTEQSFFVLHVREIGQLKREAVAYSDENPETVLQSAFGHIGKELLLEWVDDNKLSCLDIDYHNIDIMSRPDETELRTIVDRIKPRPFAWHMSHGRGAKLYYTEHPGYHANELATIAGFHWIQMDCRATFELTKSTRHPLCERSFDNSPAPCKSINDIYFPHGLIDLTPIRKLLSSEVDHDTILEYLDSRGWRMGQTLPHTDCPIQPDNNSKECVFVGEKGIFCHRCSAKGLSMGSASPGFVGYSYLVGTIDNRLRKMVRHFVHYEHAKIVLSNLYPNISEHNLQILYRIMLKIVHSIDDPRIPLALNAGKGFVRSKGVWLSKDGENAIADGVSDFVNSLPVTMVPLEEGFGRDTATTVAFRNTCDLSEYGYDDITFIRGCKIYGTKLPYRNGEIVSVVIRPEFRDCPPRYVPPNKRMSKDDAWGLLDSEFPGIDHNYLRLLIGSKGVSEGRLAQCPFLMVNGPSGSGKSTTPQIAAGICGDKAEEPIWMPDTARFRQGLLEASRHSSFVVINELFKEAAKVKLSYTHALDAMLGLTEDSRSWEMYIGQVSFGRLPVFVVTDVNMPVEVRKDTQLARRFVFYQLTKQNFWEDTFTNRNIRPHEFRLISRDHAEAADSILSEIIDDYFTDRMSLQSIANTLEIPSFVEESEEITQSKGDLKNLYDAVCKAPPLEGGHAERYSPNKGWKLIDRNVRNAIMIAWDDVADGQDRDTWCKSRAVDAEDWTKIVGVDFPIKCDYYAYRPTQIYIRFRSVENHKRPRWINGQIVK